MHVNITVFVRQKQRLKHLVRGLDVEKLFSCRVIHHEYTLVPCPGHLNFKKFPDFFQRLRQRSAQRDALGHGNAIDLHRTIIFIF